MPVPLSRRALPVEPVEMARFLIGHYLVRGDLAGRITETEAYLPDDEACHAFRGPTKRNASLFLRHGHAYVYFCYGMHEMMNVSAGPEGVGAGVLIRSLDLATGPGRLTRAMGIDRRLDGLDLCARGPIYLARGRTTPSRRTKRIGITKNPDPLWRFVTLGS